MSVRIRDATPDDCDRVAAMVQELARLAGVAAGTTAAILRREAFGERPTIAILVAEEQAGLAGCLIHQDTFSTWRGANGVFVVDFFVREDRRGEGIGHALIAEAARRGHSRGACFMRLDVERHNEAALRLYERLGFHEVDHSFQMLEEEAMHGLAESVGSGSREDRSGPSAI
jgi:ribosomal protein S18 acetylase RimI-like enzyme